MMDQIATICEPETVGLAARPSQFRAAELDRRNARRYPAVTVGAWVAWEVDPNLSDNTSSAALLLDFSERGALVAVDELPPAGARLWLGLDRPVRPDGIEVLQVEATRTKIGPHLLRVKFALVCPQSVYNTIVLGSSSTSDRP